MGNMLIDLQIVCENTDGLPTEAQITEWATAAVRPESDNIEMTVRIARLTCFRFLLNAPMKWNYRY